MLTREYDKDRGFLKRRVPGSSQVGQRYGRIQRIIDQQLLLVTWIVDSIGFTLIVLYNGMVGFAPPLNVQECLALASTLKSHAAFRSSAA